MPLIPGTIYQIRKNGKYCMTIKKNFYLMAPDEVDASFISSFLPTFLP